MLQTIKGIKFHHVFWGFFYVLLFIVLVKGGFSQLDPDFGWHLKVGQEIAVNHQIPDINTYNYTYTGSWVDHEWLSNLFIYQIYNNYGYPALVFIFAGLIILVLALINIFVSRSSGGKASFWLVAIIQLFGVMASIPHFGIRIQEVALLFVLLLLIIIYYYNQTKNWGILISLPPLFFLWANLHASFLIGFFILFSWIFIKLFEEVIARYDKLKFIDTSKLIGFKALSLFSIFTIASLLATCLTPYKLQLYSFLFGYKNKAYLSLIQEWLPQYSFPFRYDQLIYLAIGTAVLFLYVYIRLKKRRPLEIWQIFLAFVFLILSIKSRRHFPLFFIVSFSLMVDTFNQFFLDIKIAYYKWLKWLVIFCIILVIAAQLSVINFTRTPFTSFCSNYPCGAIDFLRANSNYDNDKIFNDYGWGGFMIWTIPERKLFIDGRLPQIEFAGWTFIQEYYAFYGRDNKPQEKLNQYDIKLVLMKAEDRKITIRKWEKIFFGINYDELTGVNRLRKYLDSSENWKVIYQDETAKIYFRK